MANAFTNKQKPSNMKNPDPFRAPKPNVKKSGAK